jgi:hypothetical protein
MKNQWKIMAGLGITLIALGGLATWDEWKTKQDEKEKETKGLILQLKPDAVVGIHFKSHPDSSDGDKSADKKPSAAEVVDVTLRRENDTWIIKTPIASNADQQVISDLLKSITEYKTESEVAKGRERWQAFGLNEPRRAIEIETNEGKKITFFVGINAPVGFSAYTATSESESVYAGSQYIATSTGKTLFDLRDKKILGLRANEVTDIVGSVSVTAKGATKTEGIALTKANDQWQITAPVKAKGDLTSINNFLDDLTGVKATEFVDEPDSKFLANLKSAKILASWQLKSGDKAVKITLADVKGSTYASIEGVETRYKIADDQKSKLIKSAQDLRDKRIFDFESAQVTAIEVDGQSFRKIGSDWYAANDAGKFNAEGKFQGKPEEQPKPVTHIRGLIVDLEYARAEDVVLDGSKTSKFLSKAPTHKVKLSISSRSTPSSVDIWTAEDNADMIFIREAGKPDIYRAKKTVIASISPTVTKPVGDELMPQGESKN